MEKETSIGTCHTTQYFAFISYNSKDIAWGKRLQKKLEHYRMPSTLCTERGWKRTPINPVFFAPTDIQPGDLTEEIKSRLRKSQHLIVICSPNSAQSEWVGKEIAYFHSLERRKNIHFFIVDGEPNCGNADMECFNPIIKTLGLSEILGANIHENIFRWPWLNRERAYIQLISKLLNVEFDSIWQRHKRLMILNIISWCMGCIIVLGMLILVWLYNQPMDVNVRLNQATIENNNLPPLKNAIVTITLDNETKSDTITSFTEYGILNNIPSKYKNKMVEVSFQCQDFISHDTTLLLSSAITLDIRRDAQIYGNVRTQIYSQKQETGVEGVIITIAGQELTSDSNGYISTFIPLEKQCEKYHITSSIPLQTDTICMPNGEYDVLLTR